MILISFLYDNDWTEWIFGCQAGENWSVENPGMHYSSLDFNKFDLKETMDFALRIDCRKSLFWRSPARTFLRRSKITNSGEKGEL